MKLCLSFVMQSKLKFCCDDAYIIKSNFSFVLQYMFVYVGGNIRYEKYNNAFELRL